MRYCFHKFGHEGKWAGCNSFFMIYLIRGDDKAVKFANGTWYPKHWNDCEDVRIFYSPFS